jgi:hypothetical protein
MRSISAGIAALAFGIALESVGTYVIGADSAGSRSVPARISSAFGTFDQASSDAAGPAASPAPATPVLRVASAGMELASYSSVEVSLPPASAASRSSFEDRFLPEQNADSFESRFEGGSVGSASFASATQELTSSIAFAQPTTGARATPRSAANRPASKVASVMSSPVANVAKKRFHIADASATNPLGYATEGDTRSFENSRTALYDISAHIVYMPDGRRLEAHSGLGGRMDDPRYVHVRMEGATPPNVYDLSLRESLFHGVRALRLTPAGDGKMYGRAGILAHPYMLGANGESNGCVSFSNYQAFLNAYLKGEVDRIVVVEKLDNPPTKSASDWFPESLRNLFGRT